MNISKRLKSKRLKYEIYQTTTFQRKLKKLSKGNNSLKDHILETFHQLSINPFQPSLRTHKVNSSKYGNLFSTRITGDIRIIWKFDNNKTVIITISIGGHSGKRSVY